MVLFLDIPKRTGFRSGFGDGIWSKANLTRVESYRAKQSILLHAAWSYAEKGYSVLFVSNRARLHKLQILLPSGVSSDHSSWCRVGMRYLANRDDFVKLAAALPMLPAADAPDLVIVDDEGDLLAIPKCSPYVQERSICSSVFRTSSTETIFVENV